MGEHRVNNKLRAAGNPAVKAATDKIAAAAAGQPQPPRQDVLQAAGAAIGEVLNQHRVTMDEFFLLLASLVTSGANQMGTINDALAFRHALATRVVQDGITEVPAIMRGPQRNAPSL